MSVRARVCVRVTPELCVFGGGEVGNEPRMKEHSIECFSCVKVDCLRAYSIVKA